nr:MAG TPA: hypothetical protein [Caudoviricetes sp.]
MSIFGSSVNFMSPFIGGDISLPFSNIIWNMVTFNP